jgi:membrane-bound lytic murein transglycosylase D
LFRRALPSALIPALLLTACAPTLRQRQVAAPVPVSAADAAESAAPAVAPSRPGNAPPPARTRQLIFDNDRPDWMKALELPDLPVRWYPRVSWYLEQYRHDPRFREIMRGWLHRLEAHRVVIENALAGERLPRGLIAVAMIESGFSPSALSFRGAGGFWQFLPDVARGYGLEVSFWVDERRDPAKSSTAAARMLADLHHRFGTWELALAGYNAGFYAVLESIQRFNTNDFWRLCQIEAGLPFETTEYVPKVMAAAIVERNREAFGFEPVGAGQQPVTFEVATVPPGLSFESMALRLGTTSDALAALNPSYQRRRTPPDRGEVPLRVPMGTAVLAGRLGRSGELAPMVVRSGETLGRIARARRLPVDRVRRLNGVVVDAEVTPGTTILLPRPDLRPAVARQGQKVAREPIHRP